MKYEENNLPTPIPIGHAEDLSKQHKNRLTMLYRINNNSKKTLWLAKCDCGNYIDIRADDFKSGRVKSCGCLHSETSRNNGQKNIKNLSGKVFGKLTVLYPTNKRINESVVWHCKCDCGNECDVTSVCLIHGHTNSCGCLVKKDLTNQKFGKLTALYPLPIKGNIGGVIWHCKCDCGNTKDVSVERLRFGKTASCGCLKKSLGEYIIKNILEQNNIFYKEQYSFPDLKDINKLLFDFAILDDDNKVSRLIEYDGEQHYIETNFFTQTLEEQRRKDEIKNQYCKNNNIPLVRIPYWERNNITLEMLLGKEYEI